ncbi:MAG: hypothetical protein HY094_05140 [Candidatus Melainabacteria bacterium]|nr:hypothetical protein [Candidatus Melainabacteria bacterium]
MVSEVQKYRAQFFQVLGFSFMTPIGKIVLDAIDMEQSDLTFKLLIYTGVALILASLGIILNLKGMEVLEERE